MLPEDEDEDENTATARRPLAAAGEDVDRLRVDLQSDLAILERWYEGASAVAREDDEKLLALRKTLSGIVAKAAEDGERAGATQRLTKAEEFRQNRKVLLFFVLRGYRRLDHRLPGMSSPRTTTFVLRGTDRGCRRRRRETWCHPGDAVHGFAPEASDAPPGVEDEYDILVTTDVLGQGVNLQQARNVINYDLPWNPMRVVQRNGRIDRVNSPHSHIYPHRFSGGST